MTSEAAALARALALRGGEHLLAAATPTTGGIRFPGGAGAPGGDRYPYDLFRGAPAMARPGRRARSATIP